MPDALGLADVERIRYRERLEKSCQPVADGRLAGGRRRGPLKSRAAFGRHSPMGSMSLLATLLLAVFLVGTATGQLLFKAAALRAKRTGWGALWLALAFDPLVWLGIAIYVCEFFVWLAFISMVPLWQGVMVANLDILLVMVCGRYFFGEHITLTRLVAISLITAGVVMVGWGA